MADVTTIPVDADGALIEAPPPPDTPRTTPKADVKTEYVRGRIGYGNGISGYLTALPAWIDDLTRDFGSDLYERMLFDSQVFACVHVLKLSVLAEGWQLHPAVQADDEAVPPKPPPPASSLPGLTPIAPTSPPKPEPDPDIELAADIRDFCKRQLENLGMNPGQPVTFESWLYEMLDAMPFGHRIAEKTFDDGDGQDSGKLVLSLLKTKPRRATAFVVDEFLNVLGLLKASATSGAPALVGPLGDDNPGDNPDLVPREKFAILTWMPKDGDPRGRSLLRAPYDPWFRKQQTKGEELKFLAQCACPSLVGFTAPDAQPTLATDTFGLGNVLGEAAVSQSNPTGAQTLTPEQQMVNVLEAWRGGVAAAFPHGADVKWVTSGSNGAVFQSAKDSCDREIAMAILCQTLATMEGEHQARAASETHKGVLESVVGFIKHWVEAMVERDLLYCLVEYNWGKDIADRLTPDFKLGGSTKPLTVQDVAALSGKMTPFLDPSQYPALDKRLGLPPRAPAPPPSAAPPVPPGGQPGQTPGGPQPPGGTGAPGQLPPSPPGQPPALPHPPAAFALSDAERERMASVTGGDVLAAKALWRRFVPKGAAEFGWVTLESGQHVYVSEGGEVHPSGPPKEKPKGEKTASEHTIKPTATPPFKASSFTEQSAAKQMHDHLKAHVNHDVMEKMNPDGDVMDGVGTHGNQVVFPIGDKFYVVDRGREDRKHTETLREVPAADVKPYGKSKGVQKASVGSLQGWGSTSGKG